MHEANLIQIKQWNNIHALLMLISTGMSLFLGSIQIIIGFAIASFLYFIFKHRTFLAQYKPFAGWANLITFFRLACLLCIAFFSASLSPILLFSFFSGIILLDVIDGYVARKLKQESDFGLFFDMESDALLVLLVSLVLYFGEWVNWWILIPGLLRYANVFLYFIFQLPPKKEPKRKFASYIAGFLFFALVIPFILPSNIYTPILFLATLLVIGSFSLSFYYYLKADPI